MPFVSSRRDLRRQLSVISATLLVTVIVGFLYWARPVVIPIALAVFLTFVMAPAVTTLRRRGIGHVFAVLLVVAAGLATVLMIGGVISWQVGSLVQELPNHHDKISTKLESVRAWLGSDSTGRLSQLFRDIEQSVDPRPAGSLAIPVEVMSQRSSWIGRLELVAGSATEALAAALFTTVLAAFMLYSKEDMRNRVLRLLGPRRLTATTKAVDEAGTRVSRYLRTQLFINAIFGATFAIALLLLDIRYALLWGFVACVMRYIPYIGAWIGLIPPMLAALVMTDSWWQPVTVLTVFSCLELVTANIAEPRLFGHSLGLSEVAQLVSAAFWAFMWGPIGLILSGPITACLLVIGKNVKQLRCLEVLLGVGEPLTPPVAFYQRLAARDGDEASRIAADFAKANSDDAVADGLILPALSMVQEAAEQRELSLEDSLWIVSLVRDIADDWRQSNVTKPSAETVSDSESIRLLAVPAGGVGDAAALELLAQRLPSSRWDVHVLGDDALASEVLAAVRDQSPAVVVVGTLGGNSLLQTRYLCKRMRAVDPDLKLFAGHWGGGQAASQDGHKQLLQAGVDEVASDLRGMQNLLDSWFAMFVAQSNDEDPTKNRQAIGTASAL